MAESTGHGQRAGKVAAITGGTQDVRWPGYSRGRGAAGLAIKLKRGERAVRLQR